MDKNTIILLRFHTWKSESAIDIIYWQQTCKYFVK